MTDDRQDLTSLDLTPERRAALTAAILERTEPILARRRAARGPVVVLADWLRPALAAAAVVALIALGALLAARPSTAEATAPSTAEALGLTAPMVAWAEAGRTPSLEELVVSLEEESR